MPDDEAGKELGHPEPSVFPTDEGQDLTDLALASSDVPLSDYTLGALGVATEVTGDVGPGIILRQPFAPANLTGIDARTVRVFRVLPVEPESYAFRPAWDSGINVALGFVWSRIRRPGVYAPLGLPRDRLLFEMLHALARARSYLDPQTPEESWELARQIFRPIFEARGKEIEELRKLLTHLEIETSPGDFLPEEIRLGRDAIPLPFPLPGDIGFPKLKKRLIKTLKNSPAGLPEETLFFPPERPDDAEPPWLILPEWPLPKPVPQPIPNEPLPRPWPPRETALPDDRLRCAEGLLGDSELIAHTTFPEILGWLFSRNWWMHHRNEVHTGDARRSAIRRTNVQALIQRSKICLDGPIVSIPCVVAGKIYVGTGNWPGATGGTLFKIDLVTGGVDASFSFSGDRGDWRDFAGVGSSPAVTGGGVYFSTLTGQVYCLCAATLACLWVTNLRKIDLPQNQPVDHGKALANGWSSPLVVNNRVYVACGEGESETFGFVYCLDAANGKVIWLFCTNQFKDKVDNRPNVIPRSSWVLPGQSPPTMFTRAARDPLHFGSSPWSAPAYCAVLNRIYIGTGNADPDDALPDPPYASGLLSLDATTGKLKGFFQPSPSDSYREKADRDVDVPAGPMLFTRGGKRYVCFGSKNGSFFLLDAKTLNVEARRQLLPYDSGDPKKPFKDVDPPEDPNDPPNALRENKSGVFGTAALASHLGRLFIGLGGYGTRAMDHKTTPFIRALDWATLADAWPTTAGNPPKYSQAEPPVYTTAREAALSSPAVVNDVVFVSTTKPALYAFNARTGQCLWEAPGIAAAPARHALGPAIYGNFVVNGIAEGNRSGHLYIYSLW